MKDTMITAYMKPDTVEGDPYIRIPAVEDKDPSTKRVDRETGEIITLWEEKLRYPYKTKVPSTVFVVTSNFYYDFPLKMDEDGSYFYNGSNIPPFAGALIGISQNSPKGLKASLAHDNMLQYKQHFYDRAKCFNPNITVKEFRELTTCIYEEILKNYGVSAFKTKIMGVFINLYQSIFNRKAWQELDKQ